MAAALEAIMLICFGLSWPMNAWKLWKAGTAVGTSWQFILLITLGYLAGIAAKFESGQVNWVLGVYFLNLVFLAANWGVFFRNRRLDRAATSSRASRAAQAPVRAAASRAAGGAPQRKEGRRVLNGMGKRTPAGFHPIGR